jgi:hypothetical protein
MPPASHSWLATGRIGGDCHPPGLSNHRSNWSAWLLATVASRVVVIHDVQSSAKISQASFLLESHQAACFRLEIPI